MAAEMAESPDGDLKAAKRPIWSATAVVLACVLASLGVLGLRTTRQGFDCDELENLHAAWMWSQGVRPYDELFQNHPPGYFLILRPLLSNPPYDLADNVFRARVLSWLTAAATILATWPLVRIVTNHSLTAWIATGAWGAFCASSDRAIHARPDLLMWLLVLCGAAAVSAGAKVFSPGRPRNGPLIAAGGALLALACCLVQKAVFWVAPFLAFSMASAFWDDRASRVSGRWPRPLLLGLATPTIATIVWIATSFEMEGFVHQMVDVNSQLTGWLLKNGRWVYLLHNGPLNWYVPSAVMAALGIAVVCIGRQARLLHFTAWVLAGGIALTLLAHGPWHHYQFPLLWTLCLLQAVFLARLVSWFRSPTLGAVILLGAFAPALAEPFVGEYAPHFQPGLLRQSLVEYQQVLDASRPGDHMLAVSAYQCVFLPDADPKLFATQLFHPLQETDQKALAVLKAEKPRFIFDFPKVPVSPEMGGYLWLHYRRLNDVCLIRRNP